MSEVTSEAFLVFNISFPRGLCSDGRLTGPSWVAPMGISKTAKRAYSAVPRCTHMCGAGSQVTGQENYRKRRGTRYAGLQLILCPASHGEKGDPWLLLGLWEQMKAKRGQLTCHCHWYGDRTLLSSLYTQLHLLRSLLQDTADSQSLRRSCPGGHQNSEQASDPHSLLFMGTSPSVLPLDKHTPWLS